MPSADVSNGASPLALTVGSKRLPNNCTWSQRCELLEGQGIPNESREIPRNPNPSGFQKFGLVELNKLDLSPFCPSPFCPCQQSGNGVFHYCGTLSVDLLQFTQSNARSALHRDSWRGQSSMFLH